MCIPGPQHRALRALPRKSLRCHVIPSSTVESHAVFEPMEQTMPLHPSPPTVLSGSLPNNWGGGVFPSLSVRFQLHPYRNTWKGTCGWRGSRGSEWRSGLPGSGRPRAESRAWLARPALVAGKGLTFFPGREATGRAEHMLVAGAEPG